jgi:hypothetical protein
MEFYPAWCLGHRPSAQILCVTLGFERRRSIASVARGPGRRRQAVARLPAHRHQRLVSGLSPQRQAAPEFDTTAQGCRPATSVGGVLTGRGANVIIIDDPLKPEEALSEAHRRAANEWFDHTLYSRLNDKEKGAISLIMHRLHESLPRA